MSPFPAARRTRGFTLVELMISLGIVALLSTVAVPTFQRAALRARAAERQTLMTAVERAIESTAQATEALPGCRPHESCVFWAPFNPARLPGTSRLPMDWTLGGWRHMPVIFEGAAYYQYWVLGTDVPAARTTTLVVGSTGDLDGDGVPSPRVLTYEGIGYAFSLTSEVPAPGTAPDVF